MLELSHPAPFPPIWWSEWWWQAPWLGDIVWIGAGLALGGITAVAVIVWIESNAVRNEKRQQIASVAGEVLFPLRKRDVHIQIEVALKKEENHA